MKTKVFRDKNATIWNSRDLKIQWFEDPGILRTRDLKIQGFENIGILKIQEFKDPEYPGIWRSSDLKT